MPKFKTCLLTAVTALLSTHALAGDLVIENKSSHKIAAKVVSNPDNEKDQAYSLTIDGATVTMAEIVMMELMLPLLGEEAGNENERQEILSLIKDPPLFMKEEGQKVVFTDSDAECGPGNVKFEITAKSQTDTGCISLERDPSGRAVWLFTDSE